MLGADGKPLASNQVVISQLRHKFLFGCNAFGVRLLEATDDQLTYQKRFADLFNFATLPFYWGAEKTWDVCQRFGRFGKPLNFTETTFISAKPKKDQRWSGPYYTDWPTTPEGEARQAKEAAEFYTILFSHPAVEAITWWDFSDKGCWLGAPAGLLRKDMSPKPAYEVLLNLIKKEWWTGPQALTTDAAGVVRFHGFLGTYTITTGKSRAIFDVPASGASKVHVSIR